MTFFATRKRSSNLALAIALATGTAVTATAIFPAEASAQRRDRDRDRDADQQQDGGGYGDEFRAIYTPLNERVNAEGADLTGVEPQLRQLLASLNTGDEKLAGGSLIFNAATRIQNPELQLLGMESMVASGQVPADQIGRYNFIAYQLANQQGDYAKSRTYLQNSIDANFTTDEVDAAGLKITMAESYFSEQRFEEGFDYLQDAIAERKAAGQPIDEQWYRRGVAVAYENEIKPTIYEFATMWIADYPSATNWRDAVNLTRNLNTFQEGEILDLFRLARRVGALQEASDYDYYIEAADPRRLPQEVKDVIAEGKAAGIVTDANLFVTEALEIADGRIASDRADLPELERDAGAADAGLRTVVAAGDAFLSYEDYAKAARFYERSLDMPGVELNEELTRLGIAQIGLGDYDAARETFGRVTGNRAPIARLWIAYADQLAGAASAAVTAAPAAPEMTGS
jgi:tetratricopeptide (TPR) repeat protein